MLKQDNPLMTMLTRVGNLIMVSFYFVLTCLPVITIIPACAALFHTTTKIIRTTGDGVTQDYFSTLWHSLHPGVFLTLVTAGSGFILYTCIDFGRQMMQHSLWGTAYFAISCLLAVLWGDTVLYIAPALSRFEGGTWTIIRVAFYLPVRNILCTLLMVVLLAVLALLTDFYPVLLLIAPGLYMDLVCGGVEKALERFMQASGGEKTTSVPEEAASSESEEAALAQAFSALEMARLMDETVDETAGDSTKTVPSAQADAAEHTNK